MWKNRKQFPHRLNADGRHDVGRWFSWSVSEEDDKEGKNCMKKKIKCVKGVKWHLHVVIVALKFEFIAQNFQNFILVMLMTRNELETLSFYTNWAHEVHEFNYHHEHVEVFTLNWIKYYFWRVFCRVLIIYLKIVKSK